MANRFFQPGSERASKVQALFARIAPRYDLINDLQSFGMHRIWKRKVIEMADGQRGERALDVCCGTGDLAIGMARRGLNVVGLDFSAPMLAVARRRAQKDELARDTDSSSGTIKTGQTAPGSETMGSPQLSFVQGDALDLPFPEASFDIVTVGYGLRNLADWEQGLREMQRVAKAGARLLVLDFGKPENRIWRAVYFAYLRLFVPVLGLVFCGNASAYAYILESLRHYPAQHGVAAKMQELGLAQIRVKTFLGGVMSINYGEKP